MVAVVAPVKVAGAGDAGISSYGDRFLAACLAISEELRLNEKTAESHIIITCCYILNNRSTNSTTVAHIIA